VAAALVAAGCATGAAPRAADDATSLRADLLRLEQTLQATRADLQRAVARLDEIGRDTGRLQTRVDDLDRRLPALPASPRAAPAAPAPPRAAGPPASPARPEGTPATGSGGPATAGGAGPGGSGPGAPAPGSELYQTAYRDYTRGNYGLAVAAFREFLRLHPTGELAEAAQYWVGESHFSLARAHQAKGERERAARELERAVEEFRRVVIAHPRGARVPSALYKEALALVDLGQVSRAEARLQFLADQFPGSEEAARARDDLARLRAR
jgi:TolA-binding protein